ncbi:hypothetical protein, partial [Oceanobacillus oncorhynchi]|uniref:hypothetical protein n=1 Tax=Oceanobacillus oncorhynchi TaxID=545501 RepID=UPI0025A4229B
PKRPDISPKCKHGNEEHVHLGIARNICLFLGAKVELITYFLENSVYTSLDISSFMPLTALRPAITRSIKTVVAITRPLKKHCGSLH